MISLLGGGLALALLVAIIPAATIEGLLVSLSRGTLRLAEALGETSARATIGLRRWLGPLHIPPLGALVGLVCGLALLPPAIIADYAVLNQTVRLLVPWEAAAAHLAVLLVAGAVLAGVVLKLVRPRALGLAFLLVMVGIQVYLGVNRELAMAAIRAGQAVRSGADPATIPGPDLAGLVLVGMVAATPVWIEASASYLLLALSGDLLVVLVIGTLTAPIWLSAVACRLAVGWLDDGVLDGFARHLAAALAAAGDVLRRGLANLGWLVSANGLPATRSRLRAAALQERLAAKARVRAADREEAAADELARLRLEREAQAEQALANLQADGHRQLAAQFLSGVGRAGTRVPAAVDEWLDRELHDLLRPPLLAAVLPPWRAAVERRDQLELAFARRQAEPSLNGQAKAPAASR